ncbi:MAG TPA: CRISPR-associated endonuclease Cas1, partial [Agitococcus sp.]|nr:CRISPR-associated endonuclease Cas1 [Agitococcus sp.]
IEQLCYQDLLVHQHLHKLLAPLINQCLSPASMGYRKGLSKEDAIAAVKKALMQQRHYVVQADIEDFFPSIDLCKLEECLDKIMPQSDILIRQVIKKVLYTPKKYKKNILPREQGLIQGSPLSPILANLYLDAFDKQLLALNLPIIRYGDDFVIMCLSHQEAEQALDLIKSLLHPLGLILATHKTRISHLQTGFEFLGEHFNTVNDKNEVYYARYLAQRKPLLINEPYCSIGLNGDALQIRVEKALLGIFPLRRISELVILVPATVSTPALEACARAKIPVSMALKSGYQIATLAPDSRAFLAIAAQQYQQFEQLSEQERILLAADIAISKINNSMTWLKTSYHAGNNLLLTKLDIYQQTILTCNSTEQIRGYEGAAAKLMFAYLNEKIIDKQKIFFCSNKRARGGPDRLNSLLNFGYYLLFTRINGLMRAHGLNPYLGFLHDGQDNYETLVADVQELFRVHVDRTVLRLINRQQITDAHFKQSKRGWWLTKEGTQLFANQLEATLNSRVQKTTFNDLLIMQIRLLRDWATTNTSLRFLKWDKADVMLHEGVDDEDN